MTNVVVKPGDYKISETAGPVGYQQKGLVCAPATASEAGIVTLAQGAKVTCTITNTALLGLQVTKKWIVNGDEFEDGAQPVGEASLTVDGDAADFGDTTPGFLLGQVVPIAETVTGLPRLCTNVATIDGVEVLADGAAGSFANHTITITPEPNVVEIVNTVTCQQTVTLVKKISDPEQVGTNLATDWDLTANAGVGNTVSGATGSDTWPASVDPGDFELSEDGPDGYIPGNWTCTQNIIAGTQSINFNEDGTVPVELGDEITCLITNTAQAGSVTWEKVANDTGATPLAGSTWTLTGPSAPGGVEITDCTEATCPAGALKDSDPNPGTFALSGLKWGDYTLVEKTPPPGFVLDTTSHPFTVSGSAGLNFEFAEAIVNTQLPGPNLPLTGGIGRDQVYLGGAFVLLIALMSYGVVTLNRRRGTRSLT